MLATPPRTRRPHDIKPMIKTTLGELIRFPVTGPRLVIRVLEDVHSLAENARRQPDVIERIEGLLDALLAQVVALTMVAADVSAQAREIVSGGSELDRTGRGLDGHTVKLIDGGQDLVAVAQSLDETLRVFRGVLPRLMGSLDTVEQLEDAAETMAETMEPLQGAAQRVGKITNRLSRS